MVECPFVLDLVEGTPIEEVCDLVIIGHCHACFSGRPKGLFCSPFSLEFTLSPI